MKGFLVLAGNTLYNLAQPHTFPIFHASYEFYSGLCQRGFNGLNGAHAGVNEPLFQPCKRIQGHNRAICQLLLRPSQEGARGADLSRRNHAGMKRKSA